MSVNQTYVNNLFQDVKTFYKLVSSSYAVKFSSSIRDYNHRLDLNRLFTLYKLLENYKVSETYHNDAYIYKIKREYKHLCTNNIKSKFNITYPLSNLRTSDITNESITLTWSFNNKTSTVYEVYKSLDGINYAYVATITNKTYIDASLTHNTIYYYRVRALEDNIYSEFITISSRTLHNAPTDFVITSVSASSLVLNWTDNNFGESGYLVEKSVDQTNWVEVTGTITGIETYTLNATALTEGSQYYFRIKAFNDLFNNDSSFATAQAITVIISPTLLTNNVTETSVDLTWVDNSSVETNYRIEISTDDIVYILSSNELANTTTKTVAGLIEGTQYYFRVKAINAISQSDYSNVTDPVTDVLSPSNLVATATLSTQIALIWQDNSSVENSQTLQISTSSDFTTGVTEITGINANDEAYSATGLTPNTTYYFRVKAVAGSQESEYSNVASAKTYAVINITTDYDPTASGVFAPRIKGDDATEIGVVWTFESTQQIIANTPNATNANSGLDGTSQVVKIEFVAELVTIVEFDRGFTNGYDVIGTFDASHLVNLKEINLGYNLLIDEVLLPKNGNNKIVRIDLGGINITEIDLANVNFGTYLQIDNCDLLTSVITTANANEINMVDFDACPALATLDMSDWLINGDVYLRSMNSLSSLDFGLNCTIKKLYITHTDLVTLDLSDCDFVDGFTFYAIYNSLMTSVSWPTFSGTCHQLYGALNGFTGVEDFYGLTISDVASMVNWSANSGITALDLSGFVDINTLYVQASPNLTTITYNTGVIQGGIFGARDTAISSIPIGTIILSTNVDVSKCGFTESEVDSVLATLLANVYPNGVLLIGNSGFGFYGAGSNNNAAPSAAGITDINTLATTHGWTITYWDGSANQVIT